MSNANRDSFETYLSTPLVDIDDIKVAMAINIRSRSFKNGHVSQMALDFLTAPGSLSFLSLNIVYSYLVTLSVDAERAFSGVRLQVNHLQHKISSQTFKVRLALGS